MTRATAPNKKVSHGGTRPFEPIKNKLRSHTKAAPSLLPVAPGRKPAATKKSKPSPMSEMNDEPESPISSAAEVVVVGSDSPADQPESSSDGSSDTIIIEEPTLDPPSEFLSSSTPEWVLMFQKRFREYDARLEQFSSLFEENKRLRAELEVANARIALLEKASSPVRPASLLDEPMMDDFSIPAPIAPPLQGTAASMHASKSAEPVTKDNQKVTFATVAGSGDPSPRRSRPSRVVSARQREKVFRTFQAVSDTHGYRYLYFPCRFRESFSSFRAKLRTLKIDNSRVLDVHYPDNKVVALLVHNDYANSIILPFAAAGVDLIVNFDPLDVSCLRDPQYCNLSNDAKLTKLKEIVEARLLRSLSYIRESVRASVARDLCQKSLISANALKTVVSALRPTASRTDGTSTANNDSVMADAGSSSSTGDGEPVIVQ